MDSSVIDKNVGQRLEVLRKQLGFTRDELAEAIDIKQKQMGRKIRGESSFTIAQIIQIANLLAIEPSVIIDLATEDIDVDHHRAIINILLDDLPQKNRKHLEAVVAIMLDMNQ